MSERSLRTWSADAAVLALPAPACGDDRRRGRARRLQLAAAAAGVLLFATGSVIAPQGASAATGKNRTENHCVTASGVDLNELLGVSEQIIAPGSPSCTQAGTGERWTANFHMWIVNRSFEVAPEGFVPAGATPLEDFLAKLTEVRYVIDPGTKHQRTYVLPNDGSVWTGTWTGPTFNGFPVASTATLGSLKPLPPGQHAVATIWVFSAVHCDGFGDAFGPGGNCYHAGETRFPATTFDVTPGHRSGPR